MIDFVVPGKLILALIIGAIVGLERESYRSTESKNGLVEMNHRVGVRTFSLISLLGALSGFLIVTYHDLFLLISSTFLALTVAYYILHSLIYKDTGITTEIAIIFTYLIGILVTVELLPIQIILALTVVLVLVLSRKQDIKKLVLGIERSEINAFISYLLIALVILPFLPNRFYSFGDFSFLKELFSNYGINVQKISTIELINPFRLWLIVALITGIDMAGYVLERSVGQKRGRLIASLVGGFVSSTATTISLAHESRESKEQNYLVAGAIFANMASFFQIFVLIASINIEFLVRSTPVLLALVVGSIIIGLYFLKYSRSNTRHLNKLAGDLTKTEIFSLHLALRFAFLFLIIRVVTKISLAIYGEGAFFATSALASLTGIDAVTINIAELSGVSIGFSTGIIALIIINAVNLISKLFYSFLHGTKEYTYKFGVGVVVMILSSLIGLFFI